MTSAEASALPNFDHLYRLGASMPESAFHGGLPHDDEFVLVRYAGGGKTETGMALCCDGRIQWFTAIKNKGVTMVPVGWARIPD